MRLVQGRCELQEDGGALLKLIVHKKERTEMQYDQARSGRLTL
jgi:hypothetical protein